MVVTLALNVAPVFTGPHDGKTSLPAWVVLVNSNGEEVYNTKVKPKYPVADYGTPHTGLRPGDLDNGKSFEEVQMDVARLIKNRVLVGHHLDVDLFLLDLKHPEYDKRDTTKYEPFVRRYGGGEKPSLRVLAIHELDRDISLHSNPLEDARTVMTLYMKYRW